MSGQTLTPDTMARIHAAAFLDQRPWSAQEFADLLDSDLVIQVSPDPGSFALGRILGDEAEVLTIATHPNAQRKGHARAGLTRFLNLCQDRGVRRVFLEVDDHNTAAKALYTSLGFQESGRRSGYYTHPDGARSDAIVMVRTLP